MSASAHAMKIPGITAPSKSVLKSVNKTTHDVIELWPDKIGMLDRPEFQRPLNINEEVISLAHAMMLEAAGSRDRMCTIPDDIVFGRLDGREYLIDGQHRIFGAFALASGLRDYGGSKLSPPPGGVAPLSALAQVKIIEFDSIAEMAQAFSRFQKKLVQLKPDDNLRALEYTNTHLRDIRKACPFIGYEKNRNTKATIMLSMSAAIRVWFGSGAVPAGGPSADKAAALLDDEQARHIIGFFEACEAAGWVNQDKSNERLWSSLNIGINMWLWRAMVLGISGRLRTAGCTALKATQYIECMKELRNEEYLKFLYSRSLRFQDRVPTYEFMQELFLPALARCQIIAPKFPEPLGWERN